MVVSVTFCLMYEYECELGVAVASTLKFLLCQPRLAATTLREAGRNIAFLEVFWVLIQWMLEAVQFEARIWRAVGPLRPKNMASRRAVNSWSSWVTWDLNWSAFFQKQENKQKNKHRNEQAFPGVNSSQHKNSPPLNSAGSTFCKIHWCRNGEISS